MKWMIGSQPHTMLGIYNFPKNFGMMITSVGSTTITLFVALVTSPKVVWTTIHLPTCGLQVFVSSMGLQCNV